jgi:tetratricopeptide (TPR) repeat protein
VEDDDLALMQRAISTDKNSSFNEIHTLACLYADVGKTKEARELLLRAMDVGGLSEPNEAVWLGFGRIAEQYGLNDLALSLYQRVNQAPPSFPSSNFSLAQMREKMIRSGTGQTVSTTAGNN